MAVSRSLFLATLSPHYLYTIDWSGLAYFRICIKETNLGFDWSRAQRATICLESIFALLNSALAGFRSEHGKMQKATQKRICSLRARRFSRLHDRLLHKLELTRTNKDDVTLRI